MCSRKINRITKLSLNLIKVPICASVVIIIIVVIKSKAFEPSGQNTRGFVRSLLWALLLAGAAADIGADNNSLSAPLQTLDSPRQRPRIIYKPHGIQFGHPGSAPLPARRNMPNPNRPRPYGPPKLPMGLERSPLSQILGPRGYIRPQEGFAPHPAMRFDPRLPKIPGFPSGYQDPHNIGPYQAPDPRSFGVHGSPRISEAQVAPGYQGSRDIGLQQALGPNPFAVQGPPQLSGPAYPPGYQPRFEPTFPPMNPWFGLPVPTPLGPYSQRRPVRPLPVRSESPLTPLRDLEGHGHNSVRSSESVEWSPVDTWKGAARDKIPRPPKPDELQALLPPSLRVRRPGGEHAGEGEGEVGYVDAEEEESMPEYSEEKGYVTTKPTSPSPQYPTRGLARSTPAATPPPLLDNDTLLNSDRPEDDEPSSEAEWFSNVAAENRSAEWFNETQDENEGFRFSDDVPGGQRRERPSFDHLLLI